jgi:hypothetical protein
MNQAQTPSEPKGVWWRMVLPVDIVAGAVAAGLWHDGAPIWLALSFLGAIAIGIFAEIIVFEWFPPKPLWVSYVAIAVILLAVVGYGVVIAIPGTWWEGLIGGIVSLLAGLVVLVTTASEEDISDTRT